MTNWKILKNQGRTLVFEVIFLKTSDSLKEILEYLRQLILSSSFLKRSQVHSRDFTRVRKLPFSRLMFLCLNYVTRPTFTEAVQFFRNVIGVDEFVTQQSLSEARQKVKYEAFQEIFESILSQALTVEDFELFHGYRLLAIDGTTIQLTNVPEMQEAFGSQTPAQGEVFARMSMILDVINGCIMDGELAPFHTGERQMAIQGVHRLSKWAGKCLYLMDRGYWSPELYATILKSGSSFLARIPNGVTTEVRSGAEQISIQHHGKSYRLQCERIMLSNGEVETLVTNLPEGELSDKELEEVYHLRWGIETKYRELKSYLKIDTLPGKTYQTVMHDFYATLTVSNMAAFAGCIAEAEIAEKQAGKGNQYVYGPNKSAILAVLKDHLIAAVALDDPVARLWHFGTIQKALTARPVPKRPGRSVPRPGRTAGKKKRGKRSPL